MLDLGNVVFDEELEHDSPRAPEMNLLLAYLNRAVLDFLGNQAQEKENASEWIYSEEEDPFSYLWTCSHLGLDPDYLRSGIDSIKDEAPRRWYLVRGRSESLAA